MFNLETSETAWAVNHFRFWGSFSPQSVQQAGTRWGRIFWQWLIPLFSVYHQQHQARPPVLYKCTYPIQHTQYTQYAQFIWAKQAQPVKSSKKSFGMQYMNGFLCHPIWKSSHFSQEAFLVQCLVFWKIFSFTELAKLWKCVALWLEWNEFSLDWAFGLLSFFLYN